MQIKILIELRNLREFFQKYFGKFQDVVKVGTVSHPILVKDLTRRST